MSHDSPGALLPHEQAFLAQAIQSLAQSNPGDSKCGREGSLTREARTGTDSPVLDRSGNLIT
jgi:hypothetical protein